MSSTRPRRALVAILGVTALALVAAARKDYTAAFDAHTRELKIYNGFSTALILRATYLDGDLRAAMATERGRLLQATPTEHQEFVSRMASDDAIYHEVVFSADSGMPDAREFGTEEGWLVRLFADGVEQELVTTYRIRDPNPLHRALYVHISRWSDLWIARFAKSGDDPDVLELQVGSGYGNGAVRWERHP